MRIAVHPAGQVGIRAGRILLGERDLEALGVVDAPYRRSPDSRVERAGTVETYGVVVTDDITDPWQYVERALEVGASAVLWVDGDAEELENQYGDAFRSQDASLVVGANLGSGIAPALAAHEVAKGNEVREVEIAWTETGEPLRKGIPVPFPKPVGPRWGEVFDANGPYRSIVVPTAGEWAAAMAKVTTLTSDGVSTRIVGTSDLGDHLEGLALASAAVCAARGLYEPGVATAADIGASYLEHALFAGLDVAAHTTT
ncbi:MAG: hypothetical protein KJN71_06170 [Acidimicrobiia bacterium]|nr:hypothetical protein [Acidimicrobiia bacterium]NNC74312.1 hypothetical protein [Acidimicrobiia bacterium]